ncbi:hypothetical protein CTheo_6993 [Ceratobasidium theobromae]|uniref:Transmembrane protein n=1 Tax=Ceratobasidium theobromae TaxID=1582974 RepID=A0A5N5QE13_9AGAM|nr:hypothetical protein CTheo_6993 [Ceratobasidium theobromae]
MQAIRRLLHRTPPPNLVPPLDPAPAPNPDISPELALPHSLNATTDFTDVKVNPSNSSNPSNHIKDQITAVLRKLWPLTLYCVAAVAITCFMLFYVKDNHFNIRERKPSVALIDGTETSPHGYAPLQADITTLLSIFLSFFRWVLETWCSALCWYSLFLLLRRTGMSHRDFQLVVNRKVFHFSTYFRDPLTFFVGLVLLVTTLIQYSAPLLAGAITWVPSNRILTDAPRVGVADILLSDWQAYSSNAELRQRAGIQAASFANTAWSDKIERGVFKRVVPSVAKLNIGSTIAQVVLPYFEVTSLEWIPDPQQSLTPDQLNVTKKVIPMLSTYSNQSTFFAPATMALIPELNSDWTMDWSNRQKPLPSPSTASESRILALYLHYEEGANPDCRSRAAEIFGNIPSTLGAYFDNPSCFAFARVVYRAGAGVCANCRISSNSTVQNDTAIALRDDRMTRDALRLIPDVVGNLVLMNTSVPLPWNALDDYVIETLTRSYSGAWMALNLGGTFFTTYSPAVPTSLAEVNLGRLYAWLGLQLLVLVLGVIFLIVQHSAPSPPLKDTNMKLAPFYLDAGDVAKPDNFGTLDEKAHLKIDPSDPWKIIVDATLETLAGP